MTTAFRHPEHRSHRQPRRTVTALAATSLLLSACTSYRPLPLRQLPSAKDVGDVHVAVLSVVPFEAVAGNFSPEFKLSGEEARTEALVTTRATQTIVDRATQALLSVSVPGADAPASATSAPSVSAPELPQNNASAPPLSSVSHHNAMLRYELAAALHQEVQMLNGYVRDALRAQNFDPYIVRFQVTVRPKARATPYDAEANITFGETTANPSQSAQKGAPPIVVPLLVADTQDATAASSMDRQMQQLGLAISALKGAFGLSGTFNRQVEDVVTSLGWHYQSVSNLARVNDQTLSVRLSAQPTGVQRFELLPRAHNVTVLLLVPRSATGKPLEEECQPGDAVPSLRPTIKVPYITSRRFIHATEGTELSDEVKSEGNFEVRPWATPKLPASSQRTPLAISGNGNSSYKAEFTLRGGAHLTEHALHTARITQEGHGSIYAQDIAVADHTDRTALRVRFADLGPDDLKAVSGAKAIELIPATTVCGPDGKLTKSLVRLTITPSPLQATQPAAPAASAPIPVKNKPS